jgi:hypothetical protein
VCTRSASRERDPGRDGELGAAETTIGYVGNGVFRVNLWVPGRQDAIDTPFSVVAV